MSGDVEIRRANDDDLPAIFALLRAALSWDDDPRFEALYDWKHRRNAFGPSPSWVALDAGRVVGFRALLRWEFERGATIIRAVRPVDTATHPEYQGRGIFTRLTLHALDELRQEGVTLVFNTPNDQSRRGYLKMGWVPVGRLPAIARPTRLSRSPRMAGARVPAQRWTSESTAGRPAARELEDDATILELLARRTAGPQLRTRMTPELLRWRYGDPLLGYRAITAPDGPAGGLALFRIRRRGAAREAALSEVLVPDGDHRTARRLVRNVLATADADYVLTLRSTTTGGTGLWPLPGQGPTLTARTLSTEAPPALPDWALSLGDIELF